MLNTWVRVIFNRECCDRFFLFVWLFQDIVSYNLRKRIPFLLIFDVFLEADLFQFIDARGVEFSWYFAEITKEWLLIIDFFFKYSASFLCITLILCLECLGCAIQAEIMVTGKHEYVLWNLFAFDALLELIHPLNI